MFAARLAELARRLAEIDADTALITDEDSVYYFTGYYDYLHMDFGRPTILVVKREGASALITPAMERDMAEAAATVDKIEPWNDGLGEEWRGPLAGLLRSARNVAIEPDAMPAIVKAYVRSITGIEHCRDATAITADMRMIKSAQELQLARHAGQVAMAMLEAGRDALGVGVPEYEIALATSQAGTRKAAQLLHDHYSDRRMSPNTHFLQIMASGRDTTMPHRRASTRRLDHGDPVFLCFCGMTNFHRFKLGFDRTFWVGDVPDKRHEEIYRIAVDSQSAALKILGPGVKAEDVHAAYAEVIQRAGYDYPFRCGRATGFSYLEKPQLVAGDKTVLRPGMVFAVDGSVCEPGVFRAQVGDSFIITEDGYEQITFHPKALEAVIVR